jgi:hypothetical protein
MSTVISVHPLVREFGAAVRMMFPPAESGLSTHVAVKAGLGSAATFTCEIEQNACVKIPNDEVGRGEKHVDFVHRRTMMDDGQIHVHLHLLRLIMAQQTSQDETIMTKHTSIFTARTHICNKRLVHTRMHEICTRIHT